MRFKISEIQANPFRHIDRYPIRQDKVAALRESLRTTGFWDNVVARVVDGKPQIAYGHHRLFALREEYDGDYEVNLIVRDLHDDAMLKIMARENMEEWGTSAAVEHETVRAVVEAYAEGRIELALPAIGKSDLRIAPSFIPVGRASGSGTARSYSGLTVADFLGWVAPNGDPQDKVNHALAALQFIEEGILAEADFDGLTTKQAQAVVEQARKAKAANEAKARDEQRRAEQAKRDAAEAKKQRERAEREREQAEQRRGRAREDEARQRAALQAIEAQRRADAAERERKQAEVRRAEAEQRERKEREQGRRQAKKTGQHVSAGLKSGKHGYKEASKLAEEARDKKAKSEPPPHIDKYALGLAAKLGKILDPDYDDRAKELDVLLRFHSNMAASSLRELLAALARIEERAAAYSGRLGGTAPTEIIDAEVIDDRPALTRR
jgi:hypothetical protein